MKQQSSFEQKYKDLMHQAAPDLWFRIEENLKEHPERVLCQDKEKEEPAVSKNSAVSYHRIYKWMAFGTAASAAAVFLLVMVSPWFPSAFPVRKHAEIDMELSGGSEVEASMTLSGGFEAENGMTLSDGSEAEAGMVSETTAAFDGNVLINPEMANGKEAGILYYSQLDLASYTSLSLPAGAVTLPEDTMYFSEDILGDTQLLCLGTVTSVSLETDQSGNPASLVYDIRLDSVCYSEDYTTDLESLTVKSPIVKADRGDNQILYQLQTGASYLIPLKKQSDCWELLFPFAPQVQVTENGAYLFHSGYTSLTNANTFVVVGEQEGANDFYYDRMLLRDDEDFLSDFISLVMAYGGEDI